MNKEQKREIEKARGNCWVKGCSNNCEVDERIAFQLLDEKEKEFLICKECIKVAQLLSNHSAIPKVFAHYTIEDIHQWAHYAVRCLVHLRKQRLNCPFCGELFPYKKKDCTNCEIVVCAGKRESNQLSTTEEEN